MKVEDFELENKGSDVEHAIDNLQSETGALAAINDAPSVRQEDVEGFIAAVVRIVAAIFNHHA